MTAFPARAWQPEQAEAPGGTTVCAAAGATPKHKRAKRAPFNLIIVP
jgi:hypothetical protein